MLDIQNKKGKSKVISFFNEEEIKLIIDYTLKYKDYKTLAIISVLYETGVRVTELINIMKKDVVFDQAMPLVIIKNGKGNKTRIVPISKEDKFNGNYHLHSFRHYGDSFKMGSL